MFNSRSYKTSLAAILAALALLFLASQENFAQKVKPKAKKTNNVVYSIAGLTDIQEHKLQSKLLVREIPYRVLLPASYTVPGNESKKFPVVYLLHGLTGKYNNWSDQSGVAKYIKDLDVIVVTPDGGDGWYSDSVSVPNDKYESYIIQELIPEIDKKFRTNSLRDGRAIAGLSMGGYGAIKFGLKYPELFRILGSFSGALDAPLRGQGHQFLRPSIMSVFGEDGSQKRKDNDIFGIVKNLSEDKIKQLPFIYMDCGTEDWLFPTNREFAQLLIEKKIPHEYRQLPGKHEWKFWDSQVKEFFEMAPRFLTVK